MTGTTCTNIQIILDKMQMKQQFFLYIRVRIQGFISCVKKYICYYTWEYF